MKRRIGSLLLAAILAITMCAAAPAAASSAPDTIRAGQEMRKPMGYVKKNSDPVSDWYLSFTPEVSGRYAFTGSGHESLDATIYQGEERVENRLAVSTDFTAQAGENFRAEADLTAGTTYLLAVALGGMDEFGGNKMITATAVIALLQAAAAEIEPSVAFEATEDGIVLRVSAPETALLIAAAYDSDGAMETSIVCELEPGAAQTVETLPQMPQGGTMRAFLVDASTCAALASAQRTD